MNANTRATTDRLVWLWQHATTPTPDQPRIRDRFMQAYSDELHTFAASFGVRTQTNRPRLAARVHHTPRHRDRPHPQPRRHRHRPAVRHQPRRRGRRMTDVQYLVDGPEPGPAVLTAIDRLAATLDAENGWRITLEIDPSTRVVASPARQETT
jgi:hypothetical protein